MLPVAYQEENMSNVNGMVDDDASIQNLRSDVEHYKDVDFNIFDVSEKREENEENDEEEEEIEEEDEEFEDFISDEDEELTIDMCFNDSKDEDDDPYLDNK